MGTGLEERVPARQVGESTEALAMGSRGGMKPPSGRLASNFQAFDRR